MKIQIKKLEGGEVKTKVIFEQDYPFYKSEGWVLDSEDFLESKTSHKKGKKRG